MIITETSSRVNFVDKNDNFVGYSLARQCCENAWYEVVRITYEGSKEVDNDYISDDAWIHLGLLEANPDYDSDHLPDSDYENTEIFVVQNEETLEVVYICLYNMHNGYYAHVFEWNINTNKGRSYL
ncbi:hypothetical protein [Providencia phage PSTCR6]|nr:hypothetical protein [Providencia phage PSTCR6]